jgi:hypothetical protein
VSSSLNYTYSNCPWNIEIAENVDRIEEMDQCSAQISLDRGSNTALWVKYFMCRWVGRLKKE